MGRKNYWFLFVILFAIFSIFICTNIPFQLGLDLRGGSQLTLEVRPTKEITKITPNEIEGVKAVLDKRVNGLGVSDSTSNCRNKSIIIRTAWGTRSFWGSESIRRNCSIRIQNSEKWYSGSI